MEYRITISEEQQKALEFVAQRDGQSIEEKLNDAISRGVGSYVYDLDQMNFANFKSAQPNDTKADIMSIN